MDDEQAALMAAASLYDGNFGDADVVAGVVLLVAEQFNKWLIEKRAKKETSINSVIRNTIGL